MASQRDNWINPSRSRRIPEPTRLALAAEFETHNPEGIAHNLTTTSRNSPLGDDLANLAVPTMLTVGVQEKRFLPLVDVARKIPEVEIVEIDASHAVNAQNPDQWNDAAVGFLTRHLPAPR